MCGITGAVWTEADSAVDAPQLQRMTDVLAHRGPDDTGQYRADICIRPPYPAIPGVALGHRRLAVIDVAGSRQPLANEDESIWLVFNGEIYNYPELRHRLQGAGHTLRTAGDTETLVHLYEDEGPQFLRHLVGMFALALWDAKRGRLLLARDRLGQKPLVYCQQRDRLLFASELKSVLEAPGVPRDLDPSAVDEYLTYQYVPHPNTIFQGIRKLPPAHYAVFEDRQLTVKPYWFPDFNYQHPRRPGEFVEELTARLTDAVRLRMRSDVPLGAFLSGGLDSSAIVALMQQHSDRPVKTFSIGFPVAQFDETAYARQVAEHLGTEHREQIVEPSAIDLLPKLVWHFDEPFGDSSAIPTYYLSQMARQHVTVALTGDGGDELFAGYLRYRGLRLSRLLDRLPQPLLGLLTSRHWQRLPGGRQKSLGRRLRRLCEAMAQPPQRRYVELVSIFNEARRASLYTDSFLQSLPDSDPAEFVIRAYERAGRRDRISATLIADLLTYLPCDLLHKVDTASMAVGLECRQPLLDHRVVELAAGMPLSLKLRGFTSKWILRRAMGPKLPRQVLRRPKMGFGVPLDHWFRRQLKDLTREVLLDNSTLARGYFRREAVERLIDEHQQSRFDHSARLWALLVLEYWHRRWVDRGNPVAAAPSIVP